MHFRTAIRQAFADALGGISGTELTVNRTISLDEDSFKPLVEGGAWTTAILVQTPSLESLSRSRTLGDCPALPITLGVEIALVSAVRGDAESTIDAVEAIVWERLAALFGSTTMDVYFEGSSTQYDQPELMLARLTRVLRLSVEGEFSPSNPTELRRLA